MPPTFSSFSVNCSHHFEIFMKTAHIFVACAPVTINQANINSVNSYACRSLIHSEQACYLHVFVSALPQRDACPIHFRWIFGKVPKGGGVIPDPKNFVAKFLAFETPIWGGHFRSKKFRSKKSQHFSQKRGGGGGSKAVWNFSKNSSIMVGTGFPKSCISAVKCSFNSLTWYLMGAKGMLEIYKCGCR